MADTVADYLSWCADSLSSLKAVPVGLTSLLVPKAAEPPVPAPQSPSSASKKTRSSSSMLMLFMALLLSGTPDSWMQQEREVPADTSICLRRARRIGRTRMRLARGRRRRGTLASPAVDDAESDDDEGELLESLVRQDGPTALDPELRKWVRRLRRLDLEAKPVQVRFVTPRFVFELSVPLPLRSGGGRPSGQTLAIKDDDNEDGGDADGDGDGDGALANKEGQDQDLTALLAAVATLVAAGAALEAVSEDCTGGVYKVRDAQGAVVGIWKPTAEEELHLCDDQRRDGPLREGLAAGDGAVREAAAYVLDRAAGGAAGVPATAVTSLEGQEGSLQRFVPHECSADDMGTGKFGVDNVHQVGLLDLRLLNLDRHGGNLLVAPGDGEERRLVPIDHGLSLPPLSCLGEAEFGWLHWRQAKQPFSAATRAWVAGLSADADAQRLRALGLPEASVATMRVCTTVLQRCVAAGLTLFEIGSLFSRKGMGAEPSALERVVATATEGLAAPAHEDEQLLPRVTAAIDAALAERQ